MASSLEEFLKEKDGDLLGEKGSFGLLCQLLEIEILNYIKLVKQEKEENQDTLKMEKWKMETSSCREQQKMYKEEAIFYDLAILVEIKRRNTGKGVKGTKNLRSGEINKKKTCLKSYYYIKGEFERRGEKKGGVIVKWLDNG